MTRFKLLPLFAVGVVLVASGCGGSSKKAASPATTATPATSSAATTSTSTTPATSTFATTKNCTQLLALGVKLAQALQGTSGSTEARVSADAKAFQAMANAAPSQIRADFETFASAFNAYVQAFVKAGLKPGKTPTASQIVQLEAALKAFDTPKLRTAEKHLTAWAGTNCGSTVPTTTG